VNDDTHFHSVPRQAFILSIWSARSDAGREQLRGALETLNGERHYFSSLAALYGLVVQLTGWAGAVNGPGSRQEETKL
jgi:hypothetical protein